MCLSFIYNFWLQDITLNSTELKGTQNIKLYHFVHTILSVPFCPMPFCPYTILSIPFCPYHFVRYHFVRSPSQLFAIKGAKIKRATTKGQIFKERMFMTLCRPI